MDHSNINRAALWAFLAVLPLGLACYVAVLIGTRFVKPAKRYVVRLVAMVFVTLLWYAYFLPGFVTVHGGPAWGPEVGSGPWLYGHRFGVHSIWAWVLAALASKPKVIANAQSTG